MRQRKGRTLKKVVSTVEIVPPQPKELAPKPEALTKLQNEFDEKAGTVSQAPEEEVKPARRGRRSKAEAEQTAKIESLKHDFNAFGGLILEVVCPRLPNPLPPTDQEKQLFGNAVGRIIEKYAPQLGGYDAELALAVAVIVVFAPRMKKQAYDNAGDFDTRQTGKREEYVGTPPDTTVPAADSVRPPERIL